VESRQPLRLTVPAIKTDILELEIGQFLKRPVLNCHVVDLMLLRLVSPIIRSLLYDLINRLGTQ